MPDPDLSTTIAVPLEGAGPPLWDACLATQPCPTHRGMTILTGGRVNQKLRTRNALVEVASVLLREGKTFTVADVADMARVGKTTAYRYFPTADTLIAQASAHAASQIGEQIMDQRIEGETSPAERLRLVFETADAHVEEQQHLYRTMLRLSLSNNDEDDEHPPRRSGIRQHILESAIGATRPELGDKKFSLLLDALTVMIGIEADVVLKDVCLLSTDKARTVKLWAANALLEAAGAEARAAPAKPPAHASVKKQVKTVSARPAGKPTKAAPAPSTEPAAKTVRKTKAAPASAKIEATVPSHKTAAKPASKPSSEMSLIPRTKRSAKAAARPNTPRPRRAPAKG